VFDNIYFSRSLTRRASPTSFIRLSPDIIVWTVALNRPLQNDAGTVVWVYENGWPPNVMVPVARTRRQNAAPTVL